MLNTFNNFYVLSAIYLDDQQFLYTILLYIYFHIGKDTYILKTYRYTIQFVHIRYEKILKSDYMFV